MSEAIMCYQFDKNALQTHATHPNTETHNTQQEGTSFSPEDNTTSFQGSQQSDEPGWSSVLCDYNTAAGEQCI